MGYKQMLVPDEMMELGRHRMQWIEMLCFGCDASVSECC